MNELIIKIEDLRSKTKELLAKVDLRTKINEVKNLEAVMSAPEFWQDQNQATEISRKVADLKSEIDTWQNLEKNIQELLELVKISQADQSLAKAIEDKYYLLKKQMANLELNIFLNGKYDYHDSVITIYAGAGGVEAQDWAEMLFRMYLRFCEKRNWPAKVIDQSRGTEAGIKSATIEVSGKYAYGYLKAEAGVHRLVRLSPFDADHARHTSFAMVEVIPEIEANTEFVLKDEDLKIETSTARGHGGQSVNTTYSAIRLTHLPTGIKVSCQNERSQHQNKETALKILKGKLAKYYEAKQEEERQQLRGELTAASWGNQIRSYVLHPYKMVKDLRTEYEEKNPEKVLDGEIEGFIESYLRTKD